MAKSFQYDHADLGIRYCAEGFYGIMKLRNYRADYQRAVHRLAERIIELGDKSVAHAEHDVQQMERKDFESLQSAFGADQRPPDHGRETADLGAGPRHSTCLPGGRGLLRPDLPLPGRLTGRRIRSPVAEYALELAQKCLDCEPRFEAFENDTPPQAVHGLTPPGLYLVDAWVTCPTRIGSGCGLLIRSPSPGSAYWSRGTARTRECMRAGRAASREAARAPAGQTVWRTPALPDGRGRNTHHAGLRAVAPRNGHDHAETIPQGRARPSARRPAAGPRPRLRQADPDEFGGSR